MHIVNIYIYKQENVFSEIKPEQKPMGPWHAGQI